uniref:Little elongation complex subunit 2 C-terminal domain-containing protein n=3 Tax=Schistocephalus solidus TaxID=70667 RepID=A0A0X3PXF1_SCHSO
MNTAFNMFLPISEYLRKYNIQPEFQANTEKIFNYFKNEKIHDENAKLPQAKPNKRKPNEQTVRPPENCICTYQLLYKPPTFVKHYMRLLAEFSGKESKASSEGFRSNSQQEQKHLKEFRALHAQVQKMQFDTATALQNLLPCGHCVLPINLEEKLFEDLLKSQLTLLESHTQMYQMVKELRKPPDTCDGLSIKHIKSFACACRHLKVTGRSISKEFISKVSLEDYLEDIEVIGGEVGGHSAIFISSTTVLTSLLPFLFSGSRCFFPVTVDSVEGKKGKRITLHPVLWGEPPCSRLRAKKCYTSIYRKAFLCQPPVSSPGPLQVTSQSNTVNTKNRVRSDGSCDIDRVPSASLMKPIPQKGTQHTSHSPEAVYTESDTSLDETEEDTVLSCLQIDENISGANNQPVDRISPSTLEDVIAQCVVVEAKRTAIEEIEPPASPDSTSEPVYPSSPNDHSDAAETLPAQPPMPEGPTDRSWSSHQLGKFVLLVNSSPVQLTRSTCAACFNSPTEGAHTSCVFWPTCSEIWQNSQDESKTVYLSVKPEYLLPWGCEKLSDDELWECYLGSLLDCADCPRSLNLRVNVSSGDLVFAEYQSLNDLLEAYPSFRPTKNLSILLTILSELQSLPAGEFLLSSGRKSDSTFFEIYQSLSGGKTDKDAAPGSFLDLKEACGASFGAAVRELLTSRGPPADGSNSLGLDVGPTWRIVARLPLDFNIPSGTDAEGGLLLPGLLLSSSETPVSEANSLQIPRTARNKSAKRRPSKLRKTSSSPDKPP